MKLSTLEYFHTWPYYFSWINLYLTHSGIGYVKWLHSMNRIKILPPTDLGMIRRFFIPENSHAFQKCSTKISKPIKYSTKTLNGTKKFSNKTYLVSLLKPTIKISSVISTLHFQRLCAKKKKILGVKNETMMTIFEKYYNLNVRLRFNWIWQLWQWIVSEYNACFRKIFVILVF